MIDSEFLDILACPEDKSSVILAGDALVGKANAAIEIGALRNRRGALVNEKIDGGLVREDRFFMYPVRHGIPIMLIDEAIPLDQLE